jgi:hypothetical protein
MVFFLLFLVESIQRHPEEQFRALRLSGVKTAFLIYKEDVKKNKF